MLFVFVFCLFVCLFVLVDVYKYCCNIIHQVQYRHAANWHLSISSLNKQPFWGIWRGRKMRWLLIYFSHMFLFLPLSVFPSFLPSSFLSSFLPSFFLSFFVFKAELAKGGQTGSQLDLQIHTSHKKTREFHAFRRLMHFVLQMNCDELVLTCVMWLNGGKLASTCVRVWVRSKSVQVNVSGQTKR